MSESTIEEKANLSDRLEIQLRKSADEERPQRWWVRTVWRSNGFIVNHSETYHNRADALNNYEALRELAQ